MTKEGNVPTSTGGPGLNLAGASAEQCRQQLASEFGEPYNFCYFYNMKSVAAQESYDLY